MDDAYHRLLDALRRRYGDVLFTHDGLTYPALVYRPTAGQQTVDNLLSPLPESPSYAGDFAIYDQAHLDQRRADRPLTNGLSYVMRSVQRDPLRINGGLGYYFDMMATCDALDHELRDFAGGERQTTPLRDRFHAAVDPHTALRDGRGRAAIIGGAVLTVFKRDDDYQVIVARRSAGLGTGAGLYHVLPAFVFQPSGPAEMINAEWSLRHQILREYGEELFAMPEYAEWQAPPGTDYFYQHAAIADLRYMFADGRAELHLTGVALNPLSLRAEVCALLLIHDASWQTRWAGALRAAQNTERQATYYLPLTTLDGLPDDLPVRMAPQGAVALHLGVEHARRLTR